MKSKCGGGIDLSMKEKIVLLPWERKKKWRKQRKKKDIEVAPKEERKEERKEEKNFGLSPPLWLRSMFWIEGLMMLFMVFVLYHEFSMVILWLY